MALTVLNTYKNALLTDKANCPNWSSDNIKVVLVTSGHTFDTDADAFLDDVLAANRVMTSDNLTVTVSGRNVDAADGVALNDTNNGRVSTQAFVYYDTGVESTSRLLAHDDAVALTSDGTNDVLNFNASGIFDL